MAACWNYADAARKTLAAARKGLSSHVVDRADPAELTAEGFDGRASAISTASWNLFRNIGIAPALEPQACPIASIAVTDRMRPGRIDFTPQPHEGTLGRMFANRTLRLALFEAAAAEPLPAHGPPTVRRRSPWRSFNLAAKRSGLRRGRH